MNIVKSGTVNSKITVVIMSSSRHYPLETVSVISDLCQNLPVGAGHGAGDALSVLGDSVGGLEPEVVVSIALVGAFVDEYYGVILRPGGGGGQGQQAGEEHLRQAHQCQIFTRKCNTNKGSISLFIRRILLTVLSLTLPRPTFLYQPINQLQFECPGPLGHTVHESSWFVTLAVQVRMVASRPIY